jgi:hypothetical protein
MTHNTLEKNIILEAKSTLKFMREKSGFYTLLTINSVLESMTHNKDRYLEFKFKPYTSTEIRSTIWSILEGGSQ